MKNNKTISLGKGINLTLIPEEKFKTNLVSIYIQRLLYPFREGAEQLSH